jgi:hypothetical protein
MRWHNVGMSNKRTSVVCGVGFLSLIDEMVWFTIKPLKAWPCIFEKAAKRFIRNSASVSRFAAGLLL